MRCKAKVWDHNHEYLRQCKRNAIKPFDYCLMHIDFEQKPDHLIKIHENEVKRLKSMRG